MPDFPLPFPSTHHKVIDIDPECLPVEPKPFEGALAPNTLLQQYGKVILKGELVGSESVALSTGPWGSDAPLHLIMIDRYGDVWIADETTDDGGSKRFVLQSSEPFARIGVGRPLGFHLDANDNLVISDSTKGLMLLERDTRKVIQLAGTVSDDSPIDPGTPLIYTNDLDIARDGTVYFTTSQNLRVERNTEGYYDTFHSYLLGLWGGLAEGRLLVYYPHNQSTHVLAKGYMYCNGVALSADESFVAFVETNRQRVMRYWLKGEKAGTVDVLIDALPGNPDGISASSDGNFWVALIVPRSPAQYFLKIKIMRCVLAWLPIWISRRVAKPWGMVMKVSPTGEVLGSLMDPDGSHIGWISAVTDYGDRLYFGNLVTDYVSYMDKANVKF